MTTPNPLPVPKPLVLLEIANFGSITIELNPEKAPKTVENFLNYVKRGHYDGMIFHRVIQNFMIQGGGFNTDMKEKQTDAPILNEAHNGLLNKRFTIAMARTNNPNSATAQFFINTADNDFLNYSASSPGYAVFGEVTVGQEVVTAINFVRTHRVGFHDDVPREDVVITKAVFIDTSACLDSPK